MFVSFINLICSHKQVSWVRRKPGESGLELLTVGNQTYSGDSRYKIEFQYPNNWKLKIESVIKEDEGTYECQISTYPPRVIQKNIFIIGKYVQESTLFVLLHTFLILLVYLFHSPSLRFQFNGKCLILFGELLT